MAGVAGASSFPLRCGAQSSRQRNSNAIENLVCGAEQQLVEISEGTAEAGCSRGSGNCGTSSATAQLSTATPASVSSRTGASSVTIASSENTSSICPASA